MTCATRLTKVRYRSEHFDERTGMCYHQAPPSERVVVHVRDAGQAKPHLEHNPLSLLGACYATPRRQLNDPGRITRGLAPLRTLRELMEQVYALFDRRCRTQTALDKLDNLRRRLLRFTQLGETLKKLCAPTLEKALTFLDDTLLPSTSNAVERGNRRYRKMQRNVYRVRTQVQICARLALDMWREAQAEGRQQTLQTLHYARAG